MIDITELKQKREAYVTQKAESIVEGMVNTKQTSIKISTCDGRNWDTELHDAMPQIAVKLREMGMVVTSSVNWGVTDWVITVKL